MHYYKSSNEIMQYCIFSNDIALIMHYRALLKRSDLYTTYIEKSIVNLTKLYDTCSQLSIVYQQ